MYIQHVRQQCYMILTHIPYIHSTRSHKLSCDRSSGQCAQLR
jgi:hypothetical protein